MSHPIVEVQWVDSFTSHNWHSRRVHVEDEENKLHDASIRSVGFLVENSKDWVRIAASYDMNAEPNWDCLHSIPKVAVKKVRRIR